VEVHCGATGRKWSLMTELRAPGTSRSPRLSTFPHGLSGPRAGQIARAGISRKLLQGSEKCRQEARSLARGGRGFNPFRMASPHWGRRLSDPEVTHKLGPPVRQGGSPPRDRQSVSVHGVIARGFADASLVGSGIGDDDTGIVGVRLCSRNAEGCQCCAAVTGIRRGRFAALPLSARRSADPSGDPR
jgi:hypothetical protein